MKKIIALVITLAMIFTVVACQAKPAADAPAPAEEGSSAYIALVTDVGNIDDKSFNEGTWNGVKQYAEANGVKYDYYRPSEDSTAARVETIGTAVSEGATVVVCPGFLFEDAIYEVQDKYPEVQFLLLDGEPHTADYSDYKTASNTHCILYQEEQAGYFAGYAAVKDGYTKLGFLGGMAVPAVVRFGYGFVQGADAAAAEMGNTADVSVKYWYCDSFAPSDDIQIKMSGWYTDGTEIVFSCGGGIYLSTVAAAEAAGAKVIGVDVDQSAESELIVTSAMKGLANSVVLALESLFANDGKWDAEHAGVTAKLGVAQDCVGLPTAEGSWRLSTFTVEEYDALYNKVKSGEIVVSDVTETAPVVTIAVDYDA